VNKQSLEVAYHHLSNEEASLAIWVADCPTHMLPLFNEVAREVTLMLFESYDQIHHSIFVRITHLPVVDRIRDIRCVRCRPAPFPTPPARRQHVFTSLQLLVRRPPRTPAVRPHRCTRSVGVSARLQCSA
jgi:hypothetical protein